MKVFDFFSLPILQSLFYALWYVFSGNTWDIRTRAPCRCPSGTWTDCSADLLTLKSSSLRGRVLIHAHSRTDWRFAYIILVYQMRSKSGYTEIFCMHMHSNTWNQKKRKILYIYIDLNNNLVWECTVDHMVSILPVVFCLNYMHKYHLIHV